MAYHFKNLVFEGGGVKGIAYVGALRGLEERGILDSVARVGGTSAGAINATIMACGYTVDQANEILGNTNFSRFMDDTWGIARDVKRVLRKYGWHKGTYFKNWIGDVIKQKTGKAGTTFRELQALGGPELYMVSSNISTHFAEVFSHERTPDLPVRDAVRMSMSYPLFFTAVNVRSSEKVRSKGIYVDGGLFCNYPVKLFDRERYVLPRDRPKLARKTTYYRQEEKKRGRPSFKPIYNKQTLGIRLDTKREIEILEAGERPTRKKNDRISNFYEFTEALVLSALNLEVNQHLHDDDWQRTIYVDTGDIGSLKFKLKPKDKELLVDSGKSGVETYFKWYDAASRKKSTRPVPHPDYTDPSA